MLGRDLKCPRCGAGVVDIAPDYDLDPQCGGGLLPLLRQDSLGTCANGHGVMVSARVPAVSGPTAFSVENIPR